MTPPTALDVFRARRRLQRHLSPTPLRESLPFGVTAGRRVLLKLESLNLTHSFKIRGAFNALLKLIEVHPDPSSRPRVVTASAGNHGRAMAFAAEKLGIALVVFTPTTAPRTKSPANQGFPLRHWERQVTHL